MFLDSARSLVMCNLFSHAPFRNAEPLAGSDFLFTMNLSEAKVKLRTMSDSHEFSAEKSSFWFPGRRVVSFAERWFQN